MADRSRAGVSDQGPIPTPAAVGHTRVFGAVPERRPRPRLRTPAAARPPDDTPCRAGGRWRAAGLSARRCPAACLKLGRRSRRAFARDAGGSRTHFDRVAAGRLAVWLQRLCYALARSRTLVYDLRKVACEPVTLRGRRNTPPGSRTQPGSSEGRRAVRHTRGDCPRQESNLVYDLRRVVSGVRHTPRATIKPTAGFEPAWTCLQDRSLALQPRRRSGAGVQGFEPCARALEARCPPRSTPLSAGSRPERIGRDR